MFDAKACDLSSIISEPRILHLEPGGKRLMTPNMGPKLWSVNAKALKPARGVLQGLVEGFMSPHKDGKEHGNYNLMQGFGQARNSLIRKPRPIYHVSYGTLASRRKMLKFLKVRACSAWSPPVSFSLKSLKGGTYGFRAYIGDSIGDYCR